MRLWPFIFIAMLATWLTGCASGPQPVSKNTAPHDARNRLLNAGGVTNAYDAINNRIGQTIGTNTTAYLVNPNAKLPQVLMRIKNGVATYCIYGAGLLYQITEKATVTNTLTYHYDYRGSTIALSGDNGLVTDRVEYSLYGLTTYRTGTNDTAFLFNGRYGVQTDPNGLLYMRSRYYNPYLCRFINPDPSGFKGGLNFYAYANGNPVSYLDPYGLNAAATGDTDNSWYYNQLANPPGDQKDAFDKGVNVAYSIMQLPNQIAAATGIPPLTMAGVTFFIFPGEGVVLAMDTEVVDLFGTTAAEETETPGLVNCFPRGTEVETPSGKVKIEEIKAGDKVFSYDFNEENVVVRKVTKLIRKATEHWYIVGIGNEFIKVTGAHPFWVQNEARWICARDLKPGMELMQLDGEAALVNSVEFEELLQPEATYNFEVEDDHNYFAGTAGCTVLAHNTDPTSILFSRDPGLIQAGDTFAHGPWAGTTLGEAVTEAQALGELPEGLNLNASWVVAPSGDINMVAANNRTLWVAQQAGLQNVSVQGLDSDSVANTVQTHLTESGGPFCAP